MSKENAKQAQRFGSWVLLAVLTHVVIGGSTAPLRYVQTVAGLPSLATVAIGDLIAFVIMAGLTIPKVKKETWRSGTLWLLVMIVMIRTISWILSSRFIQAYISQMVNLLAPFFVILFDRFVNKNKLPKFTLPAITLSLIGGALLIFGGVQNKPMTIQFAQNDWIGLGLALIATFGSAAYMVIVKYSQGKGLPFEAVFISQVGTLAIVGMALSFLFREDWSSFLTMDYKSILVILMYGILLEIGVKAGNIAVIRKLGAPFVSSLLAVRLVAAIFSGWLILGEKPESLLQWIGAGIVVLTITWYLSHQNDHHE